MNCEKARRHVQESLDGTPPPEEALRHLEECAACHDYAGEMDLLDSWLREEPELVWRRALTSAVMRRVRRDRVATLWQVAAAAALLLLCVWLGAESLTGVPEVAEAERAVAERLPAFGSPEAALADVEGGLASVTAGLGGLTEGGEAGSALPPVLLLVLGLLAIEGLLAARRALVRRSRS